jgi:stalled ribosome rescue protein Dom34
MKLLRQSFRKNDEGSVKLIPQDGEDMWHVFNLLNAGDNITATTFRKVIKDSGTNVETERVKIKLTIEVSKIDYDGEASVIRISGKNISECEHIKLGAHHTLELDLQRPFELYKVQWDALDVDRVKQACDPTLSADLAAVLITELYDMLSNDPARAFYGPSPIFAAAELGAIATLLISDGLFRTTDVAKRKKYAALVEGVRDSGGEALVFSSAHVSGEQLNLLSGVAAVLRFPLPDLEDMEHTDE